jgi:hypothetical protein
MVEVRFHHEARTEFNSMPQAEQEAMKEAVRKLERFGDQLGAPHTSAVRGAIGLRELRPRAGRSPWRALYRRVGDQWVVGAFGPEAQVDRRGFDRSVALAQHRIGEVETEGTR